MLILTPMPASGFPGPKIDRIEWQSRNTAPGLHCRATSRGRHMGKSGRPAAPVASPRDEGRARLDSACVGGGAASESVGTWLQKQRAWNPCVILFSALMLSPGMGPSKCFFYCCYYYYYYLSLSFSVSVSDTVVVRSERDKTFTDRGRRMAAELAPPRPVPYPRVHVRPRLVSIHLYICKGRGLG
ncbi:hypothetical protein MAPG_03004 [Magnaporthiopsis poae ATCC 64411]|uniref:Uncharacterized protein n=1 Tax=Magnaporthiopsis poae (strain ATCC 64411 / 73-15) TaxID=644358 RepID=A0A0C4DSW1_MAGP6|nr:hypothetical protein MAPG_03004 [Magnaporthiopsis poae ATCC 64411]